MEQTTENRVIVYLANAPGYVSGEDMARHLNVTRTAVWNHVGRLRALGFGIESVPHLGHRLISAPDRLLPALVANGLKSRLVGRRMIYHEKTASSSDEADKLAERGEPEGTVVIAEEQTAGRGRMKRPWRSTAYKGIYLSVILRPPIHPSRISFITLCSAIASRDAVNDSLGLTGGLKWPNDLLVRGKKVCGILTEIKTEADQIRYAIVGVGINVNQKSSDLKGLPGATSLRLEKGDEVSRTRLARAFLENFDRTYGLLLRGGYRDIIDEWLSASETIGKRIAVESLAGERCEGIATGLDEDGCLLLRMDGGATRRVTGGDVSIQ